MDRKTAITNGKRRSNLAKGCLCALGCETLYGLSYLFTKQATNEASALSLLGWRFVVAFAVMSACIFAGLVKIKLRGGKIRPLLLTALCCPVLYFTGETLGIHQTTASESGVFLASIPVASLMASTLILRKKPSKMQTAGILLTLCGVLITVWAVGTASSFSVTGYLFLSTAVVSYALYSVSVEKASGYGGAEITYAMLIAGAAVFGTLAVIEASCSGNITGLLRLPLTDPNFLEAVLYQGIGCSIIAFFLSNEAIARIGVNRSSSFIGIATVVSILSGALLLHEPFSAWQTAGAAIIITGVFLANIRAA
ncbi:MAG: DMT family transporter [Deltaproteobacteria bacterium]|nr:DMT family transporter [Deltaproteobacteria bacterium]